jgi:hypothetical protein
MRLGASLVLIAVGALLRFAVTVHHSHGFDIHAAGVVLMIVGAIGLIVTAIWMSTRRRTDVIHHSPAGSSRTTYSEAPPSTY